MDWHKISLVPPDPKYKMVPAYKEHKINAPSKLQGLRSILGHLSPETNTFVKVDHASKCYIFESIVMMSPLPELISASE